jgi:hypothetical protein
VRRAEGAATLSAAVAPIMERRAPLWSIELADGGEEGSAVVLKIHHALADGMGARRIASVPLWDEDDPRPGSSPATAESSAVLHGRWADVRQAFGALERELSPRGRAQRSRSVWAWRAPWRLRRSR